jgi:hypothetical protein
MYGSLPVPGERQPGVNDPKAPRPERTPTVIGRQDVRIATHADLRQALTIAIDECATALEDALAGLFCPQPAAYPLAARPHIATIAMQCLGSLDSDGNRCQGGEGLVEHAGRFGMWAPGPEQLRVRQGEGEAPTVAGPIESTRRVREAAFATLEGATEAELTAPPPGMRGSPSMIACTDAYLRAAMHTMAHTRRMWMLRGARGLADAEGWPEQHWA